MAAESIFFEFLVDFEHLVLKIQAWRFDDGHLIECYKILMNLLMNSLPRTFRES